VDVSLLLELVQCTGGVCGVLLDRVCSHRAELLPGVRRVAPLSELPAGVCSLRTLSPALSGVRDRNQQVGSRLCITRVIFTGGLCTTLVSRNAVGMRFPTFSQAPATASAFDFKVLVLILILVLILVLS
jgi:hypothetical protein